jgi:hypothetical protein
VILSHGTGAAGEEPASGLKIRGKRARIRENERKQFGRYPPIRAFACKWLTGQKASLPSSAMRYGSTSRRGCPTARRARAAAAGSGSGVAADQNYVRRVDLRLGDGRSGIAWLGSGRGSRPRESGYAKRAVGHIRPPGGGRSTAAQLAPCGHIGFASPARERAPGHDRRRACVSAPASSGVDRRRQRPDRSRPQWRGLHSGLYLKRDCRPGTTGAQRNHRHLKACPGANAQRYVSFSAFRSASAASR